MVGWHHQFNGCEPGQTLGDGEGQRGLTCCSPWGHKESDMPWWVNNRAGNGGGAQPSKFLPEFTTSWMFMSFRAVLCACLDEGQGRKESGFPPTIDSSTETLRNIKESNVLEIEHLPRLLFWLWGHGGLGSDLPTVGCLWTLIQGLSHNPMPPL